MSTVEHWWRAEDRRYAIFDEWDDGIEGSYVKIELTSYAVSHHTPRGVRLKCGRVVIGDTMKQFAVPTKELALKDLIVRKERHIAGCEVRLARAKEHLRAAQFLLETERY